jgi:hypothetical protein
MAFTNWGKQAVTYGIGSNLANNYVRWVAVGIGSTTATITDTKLVSETKRVGITGSPDFTETRKVTFQADFNSAIMSGTNLAEFGLFATSGIGLGSCWQREAFSPLTFDGTNELQIVASIEVI